jgi:four helix bundle protein
LQLLKEHKLQELIIFKKSYDFSKWLFNHTNKFPKSHRFSVAVRLENGMLEFLRQISIANHRKKKLPLLQLADEELLALKINLRLSHDLRFISTSSYEYAIKSLEEIGKMLGGWMKSQSL